VGGSGGEGVGQAAEMESTLALAENVYVNLPCPVFSDKISQRGFQFQVFV
jgi:hypothetical protein